MKPATLSAPSRSELEPQRLKQRCQNCGQYSPGWLPRFSRLDLYTCQACDSFSYIPARDLSLDTSYDESYFSGAEYANYLGHRSVHYLNFQRKWKILAPFLPPERKLFEVGCAYGFFIDMAQHKGVRDVYGIDVSPAAIDFAQRSFGHEFFSVAHEHSAPPFIPTILAAWDVWEHLPYPFEQLAFWSRSMPRGSIVALTTVDSGALLARLRKSAWRQIHPPTHVHYPTRGAIRRALHALGFEVCYLKSFGVHRALETYLDAIKLTRLSRLLKSVSTLPIALNLGDTQLVIAVKQGNVPA